MDDDHSPGWLPAEDGAIYASKARAFLLREHLDDLADLAGRQIAVLRVRADSDPLVGRTPARVYVHTSPQLSPETNRALHELVGRAIQAMGSEACREAPEGLSVRVTFRSGTAIVEPADE